MERFPCYDLSYNTRMAAINPSIDTPQGPVVVRRPAGADAGQLLRLRIEALSTSPESFSSDAASAAAETAETWAGRITEYEQQSKGILMVAAAGDRLVGMAGLARGGRLKTRHGGTIWGVYVQSEWRGCGVAEALVRGCLAWAQAEGLVIVKLAVVKSNAPAIRLYARLGFSVYGDEPMAIQYNGAYQDDLLMAKVIAGSRPAGDSSG